MITVVVAEKEIVDGATVLRVHCSLALAAIVEPDVDAVRVVAVLVAGAVGLHEDELDRLVDHVVAEVVESWMEC